MGGGSCTGMLKGKARTWMVSGGRQVGGDPFRDKRLGRART